MALGRFDPVEEEDKHHLEQEESVAAEPQKIWGYERGMCRRECHQKNDISCKQAAHIVWSTLACCVGLARRLTHV